MLPVMATTMESDRREGRCGFGNAQPSLLRITALPVLSNLQHDPIRYMQIFCTLKVKINL